MEAFIVVPIILFTTSMMAFVFARVIKTSGLFDKKFEETTSATTLQLLKLIGYDVNRHLGYNGIPLIEDKTPKRTKALLRAGASPNMTDMYGMPPLMTAETAEQTKLLLDAGADAKKGRYGIGGEYLTAINYAKTEEQRELLREAMKHPRADNSKKVKSLLFVMR